jgi:hypothetical protein
MGAIGAGIYAFFNRLLIPFGLHHALNSVFWFDVAGINDLGNFWGNTGTYGQTGMYMTGFFPFMMFGLPAACLAMYHTAKSNKKKVVYGLLASAAFCSFFTGVTEPIEFSFMFLAPGLYLVHALLAGITAGITVALPVRAGFSFSGGAIDLVFIQINRSNLGEVQIPFIIPFHKLLIGPDRRGTGSKPQYTIRLDNNLCGNNICRFPAHVHIILSFNNFHFYCSFSMYLVYTFPLYYKLLYSQSPDCSMYNPVFF